MKLGLENIRALLEHLGDPQEKYPTIHIAGTNGKGSVAATLAAIYQSSGKRTGLYTSPHLVDFRERIRLDGEMIEREYVTSFIERVWPFVEERKMTFFEVTTALAFQYFADRHVDIAIIETGLGGRLDATNVLEQPLAAVVTSIGMDHMAQLGPTLESIAREKAGIFKKDVPAIVNCGDDVRHVFEDRAREVGAPLTFVRDHVLRAEFQAMTPSLAGPHQLDNLRTALTTLEVIGSGLATRDIQRGVERTSALSGLHARLEEVRSEDLERLGVTLLLDAAHNPAALGRLREHFEALGERPAVVFGLMRDKDIAGALQEISGFASRMIAVAAASERALPADELVRQAQASGIRIEIADTPIAGVSFAVQTAKSGEIVLLTGSHYIIGEFLQNFQKTHRVVI